MRRLTAVWTAALLACAAVAAAEGSDAAAPPGARKHGKVRFAAPPKAEAAGDGAKISFAVSAPTDVEVAILDVKGKVVRHLAAGVLGAKSPPPKPLEPGLSQSLTWDGKDDFGKAAKGGPFKVRVRAGIGAKFGRFIGADPYNFGKVVSSAADEDGNLYVQGFAGQLNQGQLCLRVFDREGRYLREIVPFPANLPPHAVKDVARWDEQAKAFRPKNLRSFNPDFYNRSPTNSHSRQPSLKLVSASKEKGVVLTSRGRTIVLDVRGGIRSVQAAEVKPPERGRPADLSAFKAAKARLSPKGVRWAGPGERPIDWTRLTVDGQRDEVYVNDGVCYVWRFDGKTGKGALLRKDGKPFYAADVAVGYDGLLYFRKCMGYTPGVTDFSGPLERYTRDLAPANYPSGTHVLSKYIYGRYGIGYADHGIGIGPDGTVYITFMHDWHKYCVAGFGPDGKPLKGLYLQGLVGNKADSKKRYPDGLTSAVIGPIPQATGGLRVDLAGNIYLGARDLPKKGWAPPEAFGGDKAYLMFTGCVIKFAPAGGTFLDLHNAQSKQPDAPRVELTLKRGQYLGKRPTYLKVEGALAIYPGVGPFSGSGFGMYSNLDCVCRTPRFEVDRYGRLAMPNAVTNSVTVLDNAGNKILEFGAYGNFDSQYVNPNTDRGKRDKPTVGTPAIPLGWPTGVGVSEGHIYVNDTYNRRAVRVDKTYAAEEVCEIK